MAVRRSPAEAVPTAANSPVPALLYQPGQPGRPSSDVGKGSAGGNVVYLVLSRLVRARRGGAEAPRRPIRSRVRSGWTPRTCSPSRTRKTWLDPGVWLDPSDLEPFYNCTVDLLSYLVGPLGPRTLDLLSYLVGPLGPRIVVHIGHFSPTLTKGKLNTVFRDFFSFIHSFV